MKFSALQPQWYKLAIVLFWLPFIALCYFNQPYLDDYWTGRMGRDDGIWHTQSYLFFTWTGRFASTFTCVALNPMSYNWLNGVKLTALINISLKTGVLWVAIRSLTNRYLSGRDALWLATGVALIYVCLVPDKYATLYSFTDFAVYQIPAALLLVVPVAIERVHRSASSASRRCWALVAAFTTIAASASNEMTLALLGWVLTVGFTISIHRRQIKSSFIWGSLLLLLLLSGGIAVAAPGNYERMKTYGSHPIPNLTELAHRMAVSIKYIFTEPSTLLTLCFPILLAPLGVRLFPARPPGLHFPLVIGAFLVFVGTFLGALPYSILLAPLERPVNVLEWWLLLSWLAACWASLPTDAPVAVPKSIQQMVALALLIAICINGSRAWQELLISGQSYGQQWQDRYTTLVLAKHHGIRVVEMKPIIGIQPRHTLIRGYDNQPNFNNIRNVNIAKWYGLDSVRTNPKLMHEALF